MSNEVTKKKFSEIMGWSPSYVTKLSQDGRLVMSQNGKRVLVEESKNLIEATAGNRDDVAQRHAEQRKGEQGGEPPHDDISLEQAKRSKAISESRRISAVADQEEMARDKLAGALVSREDVDFVMRDFGATFRSLMENLADRLAPVVFPLTTLDETHAAINDIADELQQEMAETLKRRAEEFDK